MKVTKLAAKDIYRLTELYDYNNVEEMIAQCTHEIQNNIIDIFVLLDGSVDVLKVKGYHEFTVGVEDDNLKARHIYHSFGFNEIVIRKQEEYQGDKYEYNLYLMR